MIAQENVNKNHSYFNTHIFKGECAGNYPRKLSMLLLIILDKHYRYPEKENLNCCYLTKILKNAIQGFGNIKIL
jgi:hypothetical protein